MYGPTRLGKTLWARSLGNHAYFGGLFSADEPTDGVDYAIFDDMQGGFEFFRSYKFWLGAQTQFYVTDKYRGKKLVKWGKPSIYLCNEHPFANANKIGLDTDWIEGNCTIVEVTTPIFHANI